ncbi:MAG: hypothetical protein O3C23_02150 [bacterium]|nr:hypothetical protein [bacterium]
MPIFLIPILILIGIFAVSAGGDIFKGIDIPIPSLQLFPTKSALQEKKKTASPSPLPSAVKKTPTPSVISAPFVLDTIITQAPEHNAQISDTNVITFEFEGSVHPSDTKGTITFETKIDGIDSDWKATSSRQRKVTLPAGQEGYVFSVRAKLGTVVDVTPAKSAFSLALSPFFGKVKISSVQAATSSKNSLIKLTTSLDTDEKATITGWKIQGQAGSFVIPLGIENIRSTLNIIPNDNIVIKKSDTILLTGDQSPFGVGKNYNFRPNTCIGYLKAYYTFPLSVTSSCPNTKPEIDEITGFSEPCQEFILKKINYSSCNVPDYSQNVAVSTDAECVSYISNTFNYNACYQEHSQDVNFLKNEWHVYMNTNFIRSLHDAIELTDQNGLLVDKKVY